MDVDELVSLVATSAHRQYAGRALEEVLVTGGEPTLDEGFLVELVRSLKKVSRKVAVQTNAALMTPDLLDRLLDAGMDQLLCDLKALDHEKHVWYTGSPNLNVLANIAYACPKVRMVINTLLIPTLVDEQEILAIARFIAEHGPMDLEYRINPFRAELSPVAMSRTPSDGELEAVASAARAFYHNTVSSRSCLKESESGRSTTWITVFPDGAVERRGVNDYRSKNQVLFRE